MLTVVETELFQKLWPRYWTEDERDDFATYISSHPLAGQLVLGSGGVRKVRWSRRGMGKSGGVRVIYFLRDAQGQVVLLTLYAKSEVETLSRLQLKEIRRALED